jgi:hypothetical protein
MPRLTKFLDCALLCSSQARNIDLANWKYVLFDPAETDSDCPAKIPILPILSGWGETRPTVTFFTLFVPLKEGSPENAC